jgi:hypothetical protein
MKDRILKMSARIALATLIVSVGLLDGGSNIPIIAGAVCLGYLLLFLKANNFFDREDRADD